MAGHTICAHVQIIKKVVGIRLGQVPSVQIKGEKGNASPQRNTPVELVNQWLWQRTIMSVLHNGFRACSWIQGGRGQLD